MIDGRNNSTGAQSLFQAVYFFGTILGFICSEPGLYAKMMTGTM